MLLFDHETWNYAVEICDWDERWHRFPCHVEMPRDRTSSLMYVWVRDWLLRTEVSYYDDAESDDGFIMILTPKQNVRLIRDVQREGDDEVIVTLARETVLDTDWNRVTDEIVP